MELKHGIVHASKPRSGAETCAAVQEHLDKYLKGGWTVKEHSVAAYTDLASGSTNLVYSFIWER